jgi:hypothetical protein
MDDSADGPASSSAPANAEQIPLPESVELPSAQSREKILAAIERAASRRKILSMTYRNSASGETRIHQVEPYTYKAGKTGLMAWDQQGKGIRLFNIDDIINAVPSKTRFRPRFQVEIGNFRESSRLILVVLGFTVAWFVTAWLAEHASSEAKEKWTDWIAGVFLGGAILYYLGKATVQHARAVLKYAILVGASIVFGLSFSWYAGVLVLLALLYFERFLWKAFLSWINNRFPPKNEA